jgi:hypothetical protein
MKISNSLGILLLAIWLIASGLLPLLSLNIPASGTILALLALAAGVLILVSPARLGAGSGALRLAGSWGMLLLAIWLIITGLLPLLSISIPAIGTILAVLAIAAGVLMLLRR